MLADSLPSKLLHRPDFPGLRNNHFFADLWRRKALMLLSTVLGPDDRMKHFTWSQNSVVAGRHVDRGCSACGAFVLQVGIEMLLKPQVMVELQSADSEVKWRRRLGEAVSNFDARGDVSGVDLEKEAAQQLAGIDVLMVAGFSVWHEQAEVEKWVAQFANRPALLVFTAPKSQSSHAHIAVGNTFGAIFNGAGQAILFDSHSHHSGPDADDADLGMMVTTFAQSTPVTLVAFIYETLLPSSRCVLNQLECLAVVKKLGPNEAQGGGDQGKNDPCGPREDEHSQEQFDHPTKRMRFHNDAEPQQDPTMNAESHQDAMEVNKDAEAQQDATMNANLDAELLGVSNICDQISDIRALVAQKTEAIQAENYLAAGRINQALELRKKLWFTGKKCNACFIQFPGRRTTHLLPETWKVTSRCGFCGAMEPAVTHVDWTPEQMSKSLRTRVVWEMQWVLSQIKEGPAFEVKPTQDELLFLKRFLRKSRKSVGIGHGIRPGDKEFRGFGLAGQLHRTYARLSQDESLAEEMNAVDMTMRMLGIR